MGRWRIDKWTKYQQCTWDIHGASSAHVLAVSAGRGGGLHLEEEDYTWMMILNILAAMLAAILDSSDRIVTPTSGIVLHPLITHTKWYYMTLVHLV